MPDMTTLNMAKKFSLKMNNVGVASAISDGNGITWTLKDGTNLTMSITNWHNLTTEEQKVLAKLVPMSNDGGKTYLGTDLNRYNIDKTQTNDNKSYSFTISQWTQDTIDNSKYVLTIPHNLNDIDIIPYVKNSDGKAVTCGIDTSIINKITLESEEAFNGSLTLNFSSSNGNRINNIATVNSAYIFTTNADRDTYFGANYNSALQNGLVIMVGSTLYTWNGTDYPSSYNLSLWHNSTALIKGETGLQGEKISHKWTDTTLQLENPNGSFDAGVNLKGDKGSAGSKLSPKGEWNSAINYISNADSIDIVSYNGKTYCALTNNISRQPDIYTSDWTVFIDSVIDIAPPYDDTTVKAHIADTTIHTTSVEKAIYVDKYTKNETDNKISAVASNLDWKPSVATYANISTTYTSPLNGWTVNVQDDGCTYRYDGTSWNKINANSIPLATQTLDGKMSSTDKTKLDGISVNAKKVESSTINGNIKIDESETIVYMHPSTHEANMITQDETHRFATDTSITTWNTVDNKQDKTDNTLTTINKTIVGGINETNTKINAIKDEKVKMSSSDVDSKYLSELLDNVTIQNIDGKLVIKNIDGVTVGITNINTLQGMTENIKTKFDALSNAMKYTGIVATKALLNVVTGMMAGDVKIVLTDETNQSKRITYVYNGTIWDSLGEFTITVRDFSTDKINLTNEVTGILPLVNIDNSTLVQKTTTDTLTNKTLTNPIISTISNTGTLTLPTSTDTLIGRSTTDTLTNKSLVDSSTKIIDGTDNTKVAQFEASGITTGNTRTLTIPDKNGIIATTEDITNITDQTLKKTSDVTFNSVDLGTGTKVKMKKFTGTMPSVGQSVEVAHGLTQSKIISFTCMVNSVTLGVNTLRIPFSQANSDIEYNIRVKASTVWLTTGASGTLIAGYPYTVVIWYEV